MVCENLAQKFHTDDVSLHPFSSQFRDKIFFRTTTKTSNYADCLGMIQSYKVKYMKCDRCAWNISYSMLEYFRKQKKSVCYSGPSCFALWSLTKAKAKSEGQLTKRKGPREIPLRANLLWERETSGNQAAKNHFSGLAQSIPSLEVLLW